MIQILGLRSFVDSNGAERKYDTFLDKKWRAKSALDLFTNLEKYIEPIPQEERYNLYYTAAHCEEAKGRLFVSQEMIPFDLDGIDCDRLPDYVHIISGVLNVPKNKLGVVATGNGLHVLLHLTVPFIDKDFFDRYRAAYKLLCTRMNKRIEEAGLLQPPKGALDTSVFSAARILRLPNTLNIKKDKGEKRSALLNIGEPVHWEFSKLLGYEEPDYDQCVSPLLLPSLPPPDTDAVLRDCSFIAHCRDNQEQIHEPEWYAMLSIVGRLDGGEKLAQEFSKNHPSYDEYETIIKLDHAMASSGPRTCENISNMWDGCTSCKHFGVIKSPIQITGDDYIGTQQTGFYKILRDINGVEKKRVPDYDGLMKFFYRKHKFTTTQEGGVTYLYNGKFWEETSSVYMDQFAEENFNPPPNNGMCMEFRGKIRRNYTKPLSWFNLHDMLNFNNGVLDMISFELKPHSHEYGFRYCLPFDYDPKEECDTFDKYIDDVTMGDKNIQAVLLEFMGYSLSNTDPSIGQKALILVGEGSNGKSVWMDLLKYMAGKGNYATLSMGNEISKLENRQQLDGKLFNISEEVPTKALVENNIFKTLVTGGEVQARKLYCDSYSMKCNAKILMACNEMPKTDDGSYGLIRRLMIVPFQATFTGNRQDSQMRFKLYSEASGIFNKVLAALIRFRANQGFTTSEAIDAAVDRYRRESSPVGTWFEDRVVALKNTYTPIDTMYQDFVGECLRCGVKPVDIRVFTKDLRRWTKTDLERRRVNGLLKRCVVGFGLMTNDPQF